MHLMQTQIGQVARRFLSIYGFAFALSLIALPCAATMYIWVDDSGRRHYSDKVPPKYKNQASLVDSKKTNVMKSTQVREPSRGTPQKNIKKALPPKNKQSPSANRPISAEEYSKMSCHQKWQAYRSSEQCYSGCADGDTQYGVRKWRNVARCGHCSDVKKPLCKEK